MESFEAVRRDDVNIFLSFRSFVNQTDFFAQSQVCFIRTLPLLLSLLSFFRVFLSSERFFLSSKRQTLGFKKVWTSFVITFPYRVTENHHIFIQLSHSHTAIWVYKEIT